MQIDLTGRVALVTGGTRGIGREIAATLAGAGARVAVVGRDAARTEEAARALSEGAGGKPGEAGEVRAYSADMADSAAVAQTVASVQEEMGSLDILVNNAGITRDNILLRLKDEDWDAVLATNLRGAFSAIRAASRAMMKRRWGRIINIASVVGLVGNVGQANYAASKAGLIGLTKSVAKELASRNILANAIAPGFIETDMTDAMTEEARAQLSAQIPLGRLGAPADVASLVTFLASEQAAYITGQVFVVAGGMVMLIWGHRPLGGPKPEFNGAVRRWTRTATSVSTINQREDHIHG
jgi:3-oxoacyl-[acyl-carrier protein] reductase